MAATVTTGKAATRRSIITASFGRDIRAGGTVVPSRIEWLRAESLDEVDHEPALRLVCLVKGDTRIDLISTNCRNEVFDKRKKTPIKASILRNKTQSVQFHPEITVPH